MALGAILTYGPDYMHGLPKKTYEKKINAALKALEETAAPV